VRVPRFADTLAERWNRAISSNRDVYLLAALALSSLVAFLPIARDTSASNFFIYALLPIILVFANRTKFGRLPGLSGVDLLLALAIIAGSVLFNIMTGLFTGSQTFGLTDYVILVVGLFSLFYPVSDASVQFGAALLVLLRGATLALSVAYSSIFASVSAAFVGIVVALSKVLVSGGITVGSESGEILVGGASEGRSVFIGWACAGLEELMLTSLILYILVGSFELGRRRTAAWLTAGVVGSFAVNIFRMVILVSIAYNYGIESMLWVHTHLGDLMFLAWIGIFWIVFFKVASPVPVDYGENGSKVVDRQNPE